MRRLSALLAAALMLGASACGADKTDVATDIRPGVCFNDPPDRKYDLRDLDAVSCNEPHDNEVIAVFDDPRGEQPFPGYEALSRQYQERCEDRLRGTDRPGSLDSLLLLPTKGSWGAGDRAIACIAYDADFNRLERSVLHGVR